MAADGVCGLLMAEDLPAWDEGARAAGILERLAEMCAPRMDVLELRSRDGGGAPGRAGARAERVAELARVRERREDVPAIGWAIADEGMRADFEPGALRKLGERVRESEPMLILAAIVRCAITASAGWVTWRGLQEELERRRRMF